MAHFIRVFIGKWSSRCQKWVCLSMGFIQAKEIPHPKIINLLMFIRTMFPIETMMFANLGRKPGCFGFNLDSTLEVQARCRRGSWAIRLERSRHIYLGSWSFGVPWNCPGPLRHRHGKSMAPKMMIHQEYMQKNTQRKNGSPKKERFPCLWTSIFSGCKTSKAGCSTCETGTSSNPTFTTHWKELDAGREIIQGLFKWN